MYIKFGFKGILDLYKNHSVVVTGMKGSGKDLLTSNVVVRRKLPYVCNINYGGEYIPLHFDDIKLKSSWRDLMRGKVSKYVIPYPDKADIYISDAGIYMPSQYCNELNKEFPNISTFIAIQRHLNNGKTHYNCQNLNRVYDKVREMCDVYIYSEWCRVLFGKLVIQSVIIYDRASSCQDRIKPCRISKRSGILPSKEADTQRDIYLDNFYNTHGLVKRKYLFYINKSSYDTRHFKKLFEGGDVSRETI